MTVMLALDTSTTCTGYAVYMNGELREYNCIDYDSSIPMDMRFEKMIISIYEMIDRYKPQIVVAETTAVNRNAEGQRNLSMLLGAVWGKCLQIDAYFHLFRPAQWRKLVDSGKKPRKREELKKWSIDKVNTFLKTEINNDNVSDAILIGMAYVNLFK